MPEIKIIGERILTLDPDLHPDHPSLEEAARRELDHAPDLLYDSEDTVYRFEVLDDASRASAAEAAPGGASGATPGDLVVRIEALLAELKAALGPNG